MEPLLLQHAWLAGLALLAPAYLLSRRDIPRHSDDARGIEALASPRPAAPPMATARLASGLSQTPGTTTRTHRAADAMASRPLRIVRVVDPSLASGGRLRISGRMADVCAELDRLAAREALQAS